MPSDLVSYLATRYLIADKPKPKPLTKRNIKDINTPNGLVIQDDDESSWIIKNAAEEDTDTGVPNTVVEHSAEFRKTKISTWTEVGGTHNNIDDLLATDAVTASVVEENEATRVAGNDIPLLAETSSAVLMSDGTHAGPTAQPERHLEDLEDFAWTHEVAQDETVYRDATGQRVDISVRRAEARRAVAEAEYNIRLSKNALKGDVQIEQTRRRHEELEEAKFMPVARGVNDDAMNRELRSQQRWNDPIAQFLDDEAPNGDVRKSTSTKVRPSYHGFVVPNRYGIRPGFRWDGVDRGNGFEAMRFKKLNRQVRNQGLNYAWQTDI